MSLSVFYTVKCHPRKIKLIIIIIIIIGSTLWKQVRLAIKQFQHFAQV